MTDGPRGCRWAWWRSREPGAWASLAEQTAGPSSWAAATRPWPAITHRWLLHTRRVAGDRKAPCEPGTIPQQLLSPRRAPAPHGALEAEKGPHTLQEVTTQQQQPRAQRSPHCHHTLYTTCKGLVELPPLPSDRELTQARHPIVPVTSVRATGVLAHRGSRQRVLT